MNKLKIAIIGSGWTGISCLKILSQKGYEIDVYEKNNDVGGTWHPDNNYVGLRIHSPSVTITYPDYPLPSNINPLDRITSPQVFTYLKNYCIHFDLYKHMKFNTQVKSINYDTDKKKSKLIVIEKDNEYSAEGYDYVVHTHGFTNRTIPVFKGLESFTGKIYHSFDINEDVFNQLVMSNKNIILLGGSKTATDFILKFYECGYNVSWICRQPYWFLRFETWKKSNKKEHYDLKKSLWVWGCIFQRYIPGIVLWIWKKFKIIHTFGKTNLNFNKFHLGLLDDNQINTLKSYYKAHGINSGVNSLQKNLVILENGEKIIADVLICCTGSGAHGSTFDIYVDETRINMEQVNNVYRSRVIPDMPNLIFTGFSAFSPGIVNGLSQGNWIAKYLEMRPEKKYLIKNATRYDFAFFATNPFFDSSRPFLTTMLTSYDGFIEAKELSLAYCKHYLDYASFNAEPVHPLEFNLPEDILFSEKKKGQQGIIKNSIQKIKSWFKKTKG